MIKVKSIFGSELQKAEAEFNSAFGALEKIQDTAGTAALAAAEAERKALDKEAEYAKKASEMGEKRSFYLKRSKRIAEFIENLND